MMEAADYYNRGGDTERYRVPPATFHELPLHRRTFSEAVGLQEPSRLHRAGGDPRKPHGGAVLRQRGSICKTMPNSSKTWVSCTKRSCKTWCRRRRFGDGLMSCFRRCVRRVSASVSGSV